MWPWEHLAFGYLLYSPLVSTALRTRPAGRSVLVLAFATQLPDLVDKPLAWGLGVLPSGLSFAHSLLVAVPVSALVLALALRRDVPEVGLAFAVGYLSHLLGDVIYPLATGDPVYVGFLLWPLIPAQPVETLGLFAQTRLFFVRFVDYLGTPVGRAYLLFELGLVVGVLALWIRDGRPGLSEATALLVGRSEAGD